jgi:hypothetical protein
LLNPKSFKQVIPNQFGRYLGMLKYNQLVSGSKAFVENERRDAMYKVSTYLINQFWGKPEDITDALGVLLLTWNQALYRYGSFSSDSLENCLTKNMKEIEGYRQRDIFSYSASDNVSIVKLFNELLEALKTEDKGRKSPVAVAKALHLLAPNFFPLWDVKIAEEGYNCLWGASFEGSDMYLILIQKTQQQIDEIIQSYTGLSGLDLNEKKDTLKEICANCSSNLPFKKSIIKIIDEYNYAKFTKKWI